MHGSGERPGVVRSVWIREGNDLPGLASFLEAMFALEGMMNLFRRCLRGSAASTEAAYSLVAALAGKVGLESVMVDCR